MARRCILVAVLFLVGPGTAEAEVAASWRAHDTQFSYQGFTTTYSCQGLKDKMESLLVYFGARSEGLKVSTQGCSAPPFRPAPAVDLRMRFETLAPVSGAVGEAIAARWAERDLSGETKVQQEAPQWITRGDCELVERFVDLVLPMFSHRILENRITCIPHRRSGTLPTVRVEVLVPDSADPSVGSATPR